MVKSRAKKLLTLILVLCMVLTTVPATGAKAVTGSVDYWQVDADRVSADVLMSDAEMAQEVEPDGNEVVRAIVVLSDESVKDAGFSTLRIAENAQAMACRESLLGGQGVTIASIEKALGSELDVTDQFTITVNALAVNVRYSDLDAIRAIPGVEEVCLDPLYELDPPVDDINTATSGEMVGSYSAWAEGYTGAGSRIAIVDTGIDRDHDSFNEDAFFYGLSRSAAQFGKQIADYDLLTAEDVAQILPQLHVAGDTYLKLADATPEQLLATAKELYTSAKIPFGYDYMFGYTDYNCDATSGDHGCHVSGIAAANAYVAAQDADGDTYYTTQENGVTGIAPDAQILTMKVFSNGYGAYESSYMAAIEDAILLGCDSVNLSLGSSSAGRSYSTTYGVLLDSLTDTDTVVTMSAGNNGAWADSELTGVGLLKTGDVRTHTGGSPGSYTNSFTIASVTNIGLTGIMGSFNGVRVIPNDTGSNYNVRTFDMLDTSADKSGTEYDYVFLGDPTTGTGIYGLDSDFEGLDLTGKVVLISRGSSSFFEKGNAAVKAGAAATVIYNNADGSINMNLTGYEYTNPCVMISKAQAAAILAASTQDANGVYGGKLNVVGQSRTVINEEEGYMPSSFSSWGTTENLALKPEITAPGGNIYSTLDGNIYGLMSGTSMSAPSMTGAVAVVAQYIKENKLDEKTGLNVRTLAISLLMSTAKPLTDNAVGLPYSPRLQGAGLSQVYEAVTSPAYLMVGEVKNADGEVVNDGKVKLEFGDDPTRAGVFSGSFSIHNLTSQPLHYTLDSIVTTMAVEVIGGEEYTSQSTYELNPGVLFDTQAESAFVYDLNGDDLVNWQDAQLLLSAANGTAELSEEQSIVYDFNRDGAITSADAQVLLAAANGESSVINANAEGYLVPANGSIDVDVTILLSDADIAYLEQHFENGCYIEGYLYVDSAMGDDKQMSIPMLGFYGNWSDPSMFSSITLLEDFNSADKTSYINNTGYENFYSVRYAGSSSEVYFSANNFATDNEYIADRNAISNRSTLYKGYASLIRNADSVAYTVTDAETGEVYFSSQFNASTGAYYSSSSAAWSSTATGHTLSWPVNHYNEELGRNERLPEGTKLIVTCCAVPEYYWDRINGTVTGELGEGAYWTTTMTVDNTAPNVTAADYRLEAVSGARSLDISVVDNRYTAAVLLISLDGTTVLSRSAVNQTELGAEATVHFDLSDIYTNNFVIMAIDYAGNSKAYEVNFGGTVEQPEANALLSAAFPVEGGFLFGTLDTDNLSSYTTTMQSPVTTDLLCAARGNEGKLYAASRELDGNTLYSTLYSVDEANGYTLTALGERMVGGCTDMTWAQTCGVMLATYGPYLLVVDVESGSVLGNWSISSAIGGSSCVGVGLTWAGTMEDATYGTVDMFLLLSSNGTLYQLGVAFSGGEYTLFKPVSYASISGLDSSAIYGSSLYYKDGILFISALGTTESKLMFVDVTISAFQPIALGGIPTAPVSIYDVTAKPEAAGSEAVMLPLGDALESESGDLPQLLSADGLSE